MSTIRLYKLNIIDLYPSFEARQRSAFSITGLAEIAYSGIESKVASLLVLDPIFLRVFLQWMTSKLKSNLL